MAMRVRAFALSAQRFRTMPPSREVRASTFGADVFYPSVSPRTFVRALSHRSCQQYPSHGFGCNP